MKIKQLTYLLTLAAASLSLPACHHTEEFANDGLGNFNALWTIIDEHYCFLDEKGIDWDEMYRKYYAELKGEMTYSEFFDVCAAMLNELKDGHTNLTSPFNTSYYRNWWSDYPQNFDLRVIQEYYFNFDYRQTSGIMYGILDDNIGYMYYPSFSSTIGDLNLDYILAYFNECDGLIIDIRDNGGGSMTNVETLVSRFISERTLAGYIRHKTGPGHNDFSEPYAYYYDPASKGRVKWEKPIIVITNRSTFSAANNFVSVMKYLPQVSIVGATTGGGCGMPFNSEIPLGWSVRFSASPVYDREGNLTEFGIEPTEGCAIDLDPVASLSGHDTILDFALDRLHSQVGEQ